MRPILSLTLVLATLIGAALAAPASAQDAGRTLTVSGTGEVSAQPDMATITVGVQAEAETAAEALDTASAATAAILATLDTQGVAADDIRSGAIRLNPRYSQSVLSSGNQITGYQAINSVEVTVNDLDRLGGLLAAVVGDGANRLDGVRFGLQDPTAVRDEARRRAVVEGARLADLYSDAANVVLGDLMTLSDGGSSGRPVMEMTPVVAMEMAQSSPRFDVPTAPGKIVLRASVTMIYAISQ